MNKKANAAEAANVNDNEEVVDAKSTQVATVESTAVSTEVQVQGVQLDFPFIRIGQGMSQWRTAETKNGKPEGGAFYVGRSKDQNVKIAESGKDGGIYGIVLDKVDGFKEDRPYSPGNNVAPRRWIVGQTDADGKSMSEEACLTAAAAEGFSLALKPTGEVWLDCDVAEYLHVERRTVQRIMRDGPRPGELDLRLANPVYVGDRRWFADNVRALMREGVTSKEAR